MAEGSARNEIWHHASRRCLATPSIAPGARRGSLRCSRSVAVP